MATGCETRVDALEDLGDADRFCTRLGQRLQKCSLELAAEKTRVLRFSAGLDWTAEASIAEEPSAGILHAGICAGAAGELTVLPRWRMAV